MLQGPYRATKGAPLRQIGCGDMTSSQGPGVSLLVTGRLLASSVTPAKLGD